VLEQDRAAGVKGTWKEAEGQRKEREEGGVKRDLMRERVSSCPDSCERESEEGVLKESDERERRGEEKRGESELRREKERRGEGNRGGGGRRDQRGRVKGSADRGRQGTEISHLRMSH
jgi:hypothetical protein